MSLNTYTIEAINRILLYDDYASGTKRAEAVLSEFIGLPEDDHLELIRFIILCCVLRQEKVAAGMIGAMPLADDAVISSMLESQWGVEFTKTISDAWEKESRLEDTADVIYLAMNSADNFMQSIAIFSYTFSFLNLSDLDWLVRCKIVINWFSGFFHK